MFTIELLIVVLKCFKKESRLSNLFFYMPLSFISAALPHEIVNISCLYLSFLDQYDESSDGTTLYIFFINTVLKHGKETS